MRPGRLIRAALEKCGYHLANVRKDQGTGFLLPFDLRRVLNALRINCVFDVGANIGQYGTMLRDLGYAGYILSFEPVKAAYESLQRTASGDANWRTFFTALGAERGKSVIHASALTHVSSFLEPTERVRQMYADDFTGEEVAVETLDSVFHELTKDIASLRCFLKLDTQGFDLEVVKGAERCIHGFLGLQAELSVQNFYQGEPGYLDALRAYGNLGFALKNVYTTVINPAGGTVMEFDCLMVRNR